MRLLLLGLLALLITLASAWQKEDYEIFDLVSAIEAAEGKGTTFYSWLDVPSTASSNEIARAYRKKSVQLHPDKNPGVKDIQARFARLGVVAKILRDPEGRERYDFFYKNGVPKWRGTGYYYSRFRPGLGTVMVFLAILTSVLQYLVQNMNYNRDIARIAHFVKQARLAAWGPNLKRVEGPRKVRVNTSSNFQPAEGEEPVIGRMLEMVVDGDDVFLLDPSGEQILLDESMTQKPSLSRTWVITLTVGLFNQVTKRGTPHVPAEDESTEQSETDDTSAPGSGSNTPGGTAHPTAMAGGRRRKAVKRR